MSILSMTGFGRGTSVSNEGKINVEIKSLNSRYLDIKFLGINIHPETEEKMSRYILDYLNRGNIKVHIDIDKIKDGQILKSEACMLLSRSSQKKTGIKKLTKLLS